MKRRTPAELGKYLSESPGRYQGSQEQKSILLSEDLVLILFQIFTEYLVPRGDTLNRFIKLVFFQKEEELN